MGGLQVQIHTADGATLDQSGQASLRPQRRGERSLSPISIYLSTQLQYTLVFLGHHDEVGAVLRC